MTKVNLEDLSLSDDEGLSFDVEKEESTEHDPRLCLVVRFLVNRPVRLKELKIRMSEVWRLVKGVAVKEAQPGLFLFQLFHKLDMEEVLKGGLWTYDSHSLVLEKLQIGVLLKDIQLNYMNLRVRVYDLPTGMMKEKVRMGLGNYIGEFLEYDGNNNSSLWREYMRLKVRFDIRQPLKIGKIKANGGERCVVNFKYEKIGTFCFVCGVIGHSENKCEVRFSQPDVVIPKRWSNAIRENPWKLGGRASSQWLWEDGGYKDDVENEGGKRAETDGQFESSWKHASSTSMKRMTTCQVLVDKHIGSTIVPSGANNGVKELRHAHAPLLTFTKEMKSSTSCSNFSSTIDNHDQVHNTS